MAIADDLRLIELAQTPARELCPILNRASAMAPLIAVFATLPTLFVLPQQTLDDAEVLWGMKTLAILSHPHLERILDPSHADLPAALQWYAPLGSWLSAAALRLIGPQWPSRLVFASWLATAGVIGMSYILGRKAAGDRIGFVTALLLAFHAPILRQAQDPAPVSLAVVTAMIAVWGFLGHMHERRGPVSLSLLFGGIGLGLCLLAGGPIALIVVAVLTLQVVELHFTSPRARALSTADESLRELSRTVGTRPAPHIRSDRPRSSSLRIRIRPATILPLLVWSLTGLVAGGWWELMMWSQHGHDFWPVWLSGIGYGSVEPLTLPSGSSLAASWFERLRVLLGLLLGLALYGVCRALRDVVLSDTETNRKLWLQTLLAWTTCGAAMWLMSARTQSAGDHVARLAEMFFLVPLVGLAAFTVDEICQRRVKASHVLGIALLSLLATAWDVLPVALREPTWASMLAPLLGLLALVAWIAGTRLCAQERYKVWGLTVCLAILIVGNALRGLASVADMGRDRSDLEEFQEQIAKVTNVGACTLSSRLEPPPRLRFVVQSVWPSAEHRSVRSNTNTLGDVATSHTPARAADVPHKQHVVVIWDNDTPPTLIGPRDGVAFEKLTTPLLLDRRELAAYLLRPSTADGPILP